MPGDLVLLDRCQRLSALRGEPLCFIVQSLALRRDYEWTIWVKTG
jgi:hypothetical protein